MLTIGIIFQLTNKHDMCSHLMLNVFHFQLFFNPLNEFLLGEMQDKRGHFRAQIFNYSFRRENLSFFSNISSSRQTPTTKYLKPHTIHNLVMSIGFQKKLVQSN